MEKIDFSIGCVYYTISRRAKRDTYFEHTPIGLQIVWVSISSSVPFPKSGRSRDFKKNLPIITILLKLK